MLVKNYYVLDCGSDKCDHRKMKKLYCAVIGVGYLGKFHAEKYAALDTTELVAVVDIDVKRAQEIAAPLACDVLNDYQQLVGKVDIVSIATPTKTHFAIATFCLKNNIHVLLEKPMTTTVAEADALIMLAAKNNLVLQIGHLERFNSAIIALENILDTPKFIESYRIAPFTPRGSDINVVLDLMIHDIDLLQYLVGTEIHTVVANGAPILSSQIDIANARIEFKNGTVANVTASRVGSKKERMMRIFQEDAYIAADLHGKSCRIYRKNSKETFPEVPNITIETLALPQGDAIKEEITAFINTIIDDKPVIVSGQDGKKALQTAAQIIACIRV